MSSRLTLLALAGAVLAPVSPSHAAPPAGAISGNVQYVTTLPELATAISLNFIGNTMFASTQAGLFSYDVSNPKAPKLLGVLPHEIWENEDVDVDVARKLVFISRDPRPAPGLPASSLPKGMIEIVDVSDPAKMTVKNVVVLDGGHTTSCVEKCKWLWTGGPSAYTGPGTTQQGWKGRPIYGTDLRDPANPKACAKPIDLARNDGVTDYSHDVQVDAKGIAWVSGRGGVRGYRTSGKHRDPVTGKTRVADGCNPIPYAGGGTEIGREGPLMHNALRNPSYAVDGRRGDVLIATEENLTSSCETSGKAATFDLKGTYAGAGWKAKEHRMRELGTWTPEDATGATACASAHYVADRGDGVLAWAFYGQGTRFLDVSNPRRIRQVGYFRPDDASTWAAYFHKGYVFVADNTRGVDVIRFTGKGGGKAPTLAAPRLVADPMPLRFAPSPALGWLCPVPR